MSYFVELEVGHRLIIAGCNSINIVSVGITRKKPGCLNRRGNVGWVFSERRPGGFRRSCPTS
jgi:hypothetical protein